MNDGGTFWTALAPWVLWGAVGATVYSYFLYPVIVALLVRMRGPKPVHDDAAARPLVSFVISVYNEEEVLPQKLSNLAAIDYPKDRIQFVIGSDGSTDASNTLLEAWDNDAKLFVPFHRRRGKAPVLNDLVSAARGDIVIFSDANTLYEPATASRLVAPFGDPGVGAVCGELILTSDGLDAAGQDEISYWAYENWLKRKESDYATLLGATGGVYAIRKSLFVPLPVHKPVTDDFVIPLQIVKKGFRVIYQRDARAFEKASGSMKGEFIRRARIGAQNLSGLPEIASLLHPRAGFVAFALWSHKLIRWSVPLLALAALAATAVLAPVSDLYAGLLTLEGAFLSVAVLGALAELGGVQIGPLSVPYYVTAMNAALLVGFVRLLFGRERTTWEILR